MMTLKKEMPDIKQIRAISEIGKTHQTKSFQKFRSKVAFCTETPLLASWPWATQLPPCHGWQQGADPEIY